MSSPSLNKMPGAATIEHNEHIQDEIDVPAYNNPDEVPEFSWRTWVALASMSVIQFVQIAALIGPPTALTFIARELNGADRQNWVVNVTTLAQAALGPILSSASDKFQSRKLIIVVASFIAMIGSAIAPGSKGIERLIAAQVLVGLGISAAPLTYAVPSEILPRKWRPIAQAIVNTFGSTGAVVAPLILGALTRQSPAQWRYFFWIQTALWGAAAIGVLVGYLPPKAETPIDGLSFVQKLLSLDLIGAALLTAGITLLITGLNFGGQLFTWTQAQTLGPLISGILALLAFGIYETWGTKTGILHHSLFHGNGKRQASGFAIFCVLFFLEGAMFFATAVWYPVIVVSLFERDPLIQAVYFVPINAVAVLASMAYGIISSKAKSVRWPLCVGFLLWTAGLVGQATVEPGHRATLLGTAALIGLGLAGPLLLIIAGVQLSTPPKLLATGSAAVVCMRGLGATIFTAINSAVAQNRLGNLIPKKIAEAVLPLGLPPSSLGPFIGLLSSQNFSALPSVPGVTPEIIGAGSQGLEHAFADGIRVVFIIAAALGVLACVLTACLGSLRDAMDYTVDAPLEKVHVATNEKEATKA